MTRRKPWGLGVPYGESADLVLWMGSRDGKALC
jgi:hypothetical protein